MPKVVGLEIGKHEAVAVEMEGSSRRFKLNKVAVLSYSDLHPEEAPDVVERQEEEAATLEGDESSEQLTKLCAALFKKHHLSRDNVALAFPGRHCVVRHMTLPFKGIDAIRKVIKFEAESEIQSRSVDDMIVDFHVVRETQDATELLVFAVPKPVLKSRLVALARANVEPEVVDLDSMALFRCAEVLGVFTGKLPVPAAATDLQVVGDSSETFVVLEDEEVADKAASGEAAEAPADKRGKKKTAPAAATGNVLLINVGADASEIVVAVNGQLHAVRTLRTGIDSIAEAIGRAYHLLPSQGREALQTVIDGDPLEPMPQLALPAPAAEAVDEGGTATPAASEIPDAVPASILVQDRVVFDECAQFNARFVRELVRFLSSISLPGGLQRVLVTGRGGYLPGLKDSLSATLSAPVEDLDPLAMIEHSLPEDEVYEASRRVGVAIGLALCALGAAEGLQFRQEDLAYSRKFDRLKFPLAIVCMLAAFLLFIGDIFLWRKATRYEASLDAKNGIVRQLESKILGMVIDRSELEKIRAELDRLDVTKRLSTLSTKAETARNKFQEKLGVYKGLRLESGFAVLVRMLAAIEQTAPRMGKFMVTEIKLDLPSIKDQRKLVFVIFYRGDDVRGHDVALRETLRKDCGEPGSPFADLDQRIVPKPVEGGTEYTYELKIKETFAVFQPE